MLVDLCRLRNSNFVHTDYVFASAVECWIQICVRLKRTMLVNNWATVLVLSPFLQIGTVIDSVAIPFIQNRMSCVPQHAA
jgi:hypothetical protein